MYWLPENIIAIAMLRENCKNVILIKFQIGKILINVIYQCNSHKISVKTDR